MGRRFQWRIKLKQKILEEEASGKELEKSVVSFSRFPSCPYQEESKRRSTSSTAAETAVSRIRSLVTAGVASLRRDVNSVSLVIGTLYGHRRGHVRFAFQTDATVGPVLVELATPTYALVREMASGLARIALECERKPPATGKPARALAEEPVWKAYVNGKSCGFAVRRECREPDWKLMRAVQPVSMGAGVIPAGAGEQDVMYMRARFERVVGSKDSEAFYMLNPDDGHVGPELSVYFLRI